MRTNVDGFLSNRQTRETLAALVMVGPAALLLILFMIYPFINGISLSRTNQRFDGSEARDVGWENYDSVLSINLIRLPDIPDEMPEDTPPAGWYRGSDGEAIFRWRPRNLDEVGLGQYEEYEIATNFAIGDAQYAIIAKDPTFWKSLVNNFKFAIVVIPVQTALALFLAILVNQKLPFRNVFRTIYFSPVVTAMVIIAVVWGFMYNPNFGLINEMLGVFGLGPYRWLDHPASAMPAIMIMSIWQGVGFQMIIFLAGLQDIPEDLYESASIDGAGMLNKFRFITLPMLRNTTIFVVVTTTILAFRLFDQVNVMTPNGGPELSTGTMVWYAIRRGWRNGEIGYATAISIVFVGIVLIVSIIQRTVVKSESALDR